MTLIDNIGSAFQKSGYVSDSQQWKAFTINFAHGEEQLLQLINSNIGYNGKGEDCNGIYEIYLGNVLQYRGKGKPIRKRLLDHFSASQDIRNQNRYWVEFWSGLKEVNLTVRWIEIDQYSDPTAGELLRCIFEGVRSYVHKPAFEVFKSRRLAEEREVRKKRFSEKLVNNPPDLLEVVEVSD